MQTKMFRRSRLNKDKQLQVEVWYLVAVVSLPELATNSTNSAQSASSMARTRTTSMDSLIAKSIMKPTSSISATSAATLLLTIVGVSTTTACTAMIERGLQATSARVRKTALSALSTLLMVPTRLLQSAAECAES